MRCAKRMFLSALLFVVVLLSVPCAFSGLGDFEVHPNVDISGLLNRNYDITLEDMVISAHGGRIFWTDSLAADIVNIDFRVLLNGQERATGNSGSPARISHDTIRQVFGGDLLHDITVTVESTNIDIGGSLGIDCNNDCPSGYQYLCGFDMGFTHPSLPHNCFTCLSACWEHEGYPDQKHLRTDTFQMCRNECGGSDLHKKKCGSDIPKPITDRDYICLGSRIIGMCNAWVETPDHCCGNNALNNLEECDIVNGVAEYANSRFRCSDHGFTGGTLDCRDCKYDTSNCHTCGDGVREDGEQCDGDDLGGATCSSATGGADPFGDLACHSDCSFDTSACFGNIPCSTSAGGACEGSQYASCIPGLDMDTRRYNLAATFAYSGGVPADCPAGRTCYCIECSQGWDLDGNAECTQEKRECDPGNTIACFQHSSSDRGHLYCIQGNMACCSNFPSDYNYNFWVPVIPIN